MAEVPVGLESFRPNGEGPHPLFLDTSGLYPYFYSRAKQHEEVSRFFEALGRNRLPYRPLLTNRYVLDELVSLLLSHAGHGTALRALRTLRVSSAVRVLPVTDADFEGAVERFETYTDHDISLTDHAVALQAEANGATHVLTYDGDFAALGLESVPKR